MNEIIEQVPVTYYQDGVQKNFFQKTWHTKKLHAVLDFIPGYPKRVLDVGCASGWFISQIANIYPQAKYTGIDVYEQAIAYGQKTYPNITFKKADAEKLPFPSETFDIVISTEVLEHVHHPEKMIKEIKRVLKKNGHAIIELDSGNWLFGLVWSLWTRLQGKVWDHAHLHVFSPAILESMLRKEKFVLIKKRTFNWTMAMIFLVQKS